jgi:hypothetical protein
MVEQAFRPDRITQGRLERLPHQIRTGSGYFPAFAFASFASTADQFTTFHHASR